MRNLTKYEKYNKFFFIKNWNPQNMPLKCTDTKFTQIITLKRPKEKNDIPTIIIHV